MLSMQMMEPVVVWEGGNCSNGGGGGSDASEGDNDGAYSDEADIELIVMFEVMVVMMQMLSSLWHGKRWW